MSDSSSPLWYVIDSSILYLAGLVFFIIQDAQMIKDNRTAGVSIVAFSYSAAVNLGWMISGIIVNSFSTWVSSLVYVFAALSVVVIKIYLESSFSAAKQETLDNVMRGRLWLSQFDEYEIKPGHVLYVLRDERIAAKTLETEKNLDEVRYVYCDDARQTACFFNPENAKKVLQQLYNNERGIGTYKTYSSAELHRMCKSYKRSRIFGIFPRANKPSRIHNSCAFFKECCRKMWCSSV